MERDMKYNNLEYCADVTIMEVLEKFQFKFILYLRTAQLI